MYGYFNNRTVSVMTRKCNFWRAFGNVFKGAETFDFCVGAHRISCLIGHLIQKYTSSLYPFRFFAPSIRCIHLVKMLFFIRPTVKKLNWNQEEPCSKFNHKKESLITTMAHQSNSFRIRNIYGSFEGDVLKYPRRARGSKKI